MNTYQTGKIGMTEGSGLVFITVLARIFLTAVPQSIDAVAQAVCFSVMLNGVWILASMYLFTYVCSRISPDLFVAMEELLGTVAARLIYGFYIVLFLTDSIMLLRQYAENTLITTLPHTDLQFVMLGFMLVIGSLAYLGIGAIARTACLLLPFLIGGILLTFLMLYPYYQPYQLSPLQGNGLIPLCRQGFFGSAYNLGALLPVFLAVSFQKAKTVKAASLYGTASAVLIKVMFMLSYLMTFGVDVGTEKIMPFFEMVRLIYFGRYIQRIEALFILIWIFVGILSIAGLFYLGLYLLARLLQWPAIRPIVPLAIVLASEAAMSFPNIDCVFIADRIFTFVSALGIFGIPVLLTVVAFLKQGDKPCESA